LSEGIKGRWKQGGGEGEIGYKERGGNVSTRRKNAFSMWRKAEWRGGELSLIRGGQLSVDEKLGA